MCILSQGKKVYLDLIALAVARPQLMKDSMRAVNTLHQNKGNYVAETRVRHGKNEEK